jgi:GTP-binding protein
MKIVSAEFLTSAPDLASCPRSVVPEFAFIGRSNVGKSSLINLLTGRKALAKVSGTPGKTRLINFFEINRQWRLVDLPGYGFAKTGRETRSLLNLAASGYLAGRENLRATFVLLDGRLPPQPLDLAFVAWAAEQGLPCAWVFTKTEKLTPTAITRAQAAMDAARLAQQLPPPLAMMATSARTGTGRGEVLACIGRLLREDG